ncbi:MAG: hypothetical protein JXP48_13375 [Acidobacteria bacterium]|nr:hypothetical protein [Acidobacteriota bacterium]
MTLPIRICIACAAISALAAAGGDAPLRLGQDSVLVWKTQSPHQETTFVARIARFGPDRFLEWEDGRSQGTVFMPEEVVLEAKGFETSSHFKAGMDRRARNSTTLWLSRRIFRELKEKKAAKCVLDGVSTRFRLGGEAETEVEVNGAPVRLRVMKVLDGRGGERWFLDDEDNPLLVRYTLRSYEQKLTGVTTDRQNTLRWIKGKKLMDGP